jgi:hypothetical protein
MLRPIFVLLLSLVGPGLSLPMAAKKEGKFSLFSVITFPNKYTTIKHLLLVKIPIQFFIISVCVPVSDLTMKGTCLTAKECGEASGTSDGNCASGFGVCCVL